MGTRYEQEDDFLKEPLDFREVLEKNEQETRYDTLIKRRKKIRIRKKRVKIILLIMTIGILTYYFCTDISNVRVLRVRDNVVYTQTQIFKKAGLDYGSKLLFHPVFAIEDVLEKDPLIKDVDVEKNYLSGAIYIKVEEEKLIGNYEEEGKYYVLLANGESYEHDASNFVLLDTPYINGFDKKKRIELAKAFSKIEQKDYKMISEVSKHEESYDKNMLKLKMDDGHIVITDYAGLVQLKYYRKMLKNKTVNSWCLMMTKESDTAYYYNCE